MDTKDLKERRHLMEKAIAKTILKETESFLKDTEIHVVSFGIVLHSEARKMSAVEITCKMMIQGDESENG